MRIFDSFSRGASRLAMAEAPAPLHRFVIVKRLHRVLAFTGWTIDDVVNNPIAKNQVRGFYKLSKQIDRRSEIIDLERQWNPRA